MLTAGAEPSGPSGDRGAAQLATAARAPRALVAQCREHVVSRRYASPRKTLPQHALHRMEEFCPLARSKRPHATTRVDPRAPKRGVNRQVAKACNDRLIHQHCL